MTRMLLGACVAVWGVAGAAPPPAPAQETEPRRERTRSVGISVSPWLFMSDYNTDSSGVGVWLQVGRFQIDHTFGLRTWSSGPHRAFPEKPTRRLGGHATTVLFDLMTWRRPRYVARFRVGGGYRMELDQFPFLLVLDKEELRRRNVHPYPTSTEWRFATLHAGLTFDFAVGGRSLVRAGTLTVQPLVPEPRLGFGWRF